jgi:hypothetical protein
VTFTRDTGLGIAALVLAGAYYAESTNIQQSLLADAVGADGVPRVIAIGMAASGLALVLRSVWRPTVSADEAQPPNALAKAAGLLAILVVYLVGVPIIGYPLAVTALIAAVAFYAGAKANVVLAATAIGGAATFWFMFKWLLGIQLPVGMLSWG